MDYARQLYHAGICPVFLRKTRTIFDESSFDPVQSIFVYIHRNRKSILYTVYLQKILFYTYYCILYINKHKIYTLFINIHIHLKCKTNDESRQNILRSVR